MKDKKRVSGRLTALPAFALLLALTACGGTGGGGPPRAMTDGIRQLAADTVPEPDPLALDEGDELIFYHANQNYSSGISTPWGLKRAENWVKMTREEEEEYFGISFELTDAVPDLAITGMGTGLGLGRYEDEFGVSYDVIGAEYKSEDRHRTVTFYVGRVWKTIWFSDHYQETKIPASRVNGVEIKILSSTVEYWEVETEEGWEWYWEDEPDRPEEAVYYSGPYYQAEFDCHGNHFSLQASGLTQEEFGRILKHLTSPKAPA